MHKDSWLYSDSFLKRAFAIWGHNLVAGLIIGGFFLALFLLASVLGMALGISMHTAP